MDQNTPYWSNTRTNSVTDWDGDMEQRTSTRRGRTTSENIVGNVNGYGCEDDVKDIDKDDK